MKKLFYLLLALPMLMVACDPEPEPQPQPEPTPETKPELTLTSDATLNFKAEGGEGTITYTLKNAVEGVEVEATCEAVWVSNITVADDVTFVVAANDGDARNTKVVVKYDTLSFEVTVKQEAKANDNPNPEATEMVYLDGTYYAPGYWRETDTAHNFYIILSSATQVNTYEPNAAYLELDIWAASGDASNPVIPAGEYVFDFNETCAANTIGCYYSSLTLTDASAAVSNEIYPVEGKVVVSADKIEVNFTDAYGDAYAFVYNGAPALPVVETGAVEVNGTNYYIEVVNYDDYYEVGADNYVFTIVEDTTTYNGVYFTLEVLAPQGGSYNGEYSVLVDANDVMNKFIPGTIESNYLVGCWYAILEGGYVTDVYQPLYGGTFTIATDDQNVATFTFNCVDDRDNSISGTISGSIIEAAPQALSANTKAPRLTTMTRKSIR